MARFRKHTMDHDNDGHKGGSLKAGTRFVPGTMDHDNSGKMGGSLKGDDMTKRANDAAPLKGEEAAKALSDAANAASPAKEAPQKPAKADDTAVRLDALEAEVRRLRTRLGKAEQSNSEVRQVVAPRLRSRGIEV